MKKSPVFIVLLLFCTFSSIRAQFAHTKWKGTLFLDYTVTVLWDFDKDTVQVFTLPDSALVEKMTYQVEPGFLLLTKVSGMSPCDETTVGKYKFEIKEDSLTIAPVLDPCEARSSASSSEPYVRVK
jgi:hypothetical protein